MGTPPGKPASPEVALAGADGAALAAMIRGAKAAGVSTLSRVVAAALSRYPGEGPVLSAADLTTLATSYAAVNSAAELLGRSRVREMADRAGPVRMRDDGSGILSSFGATPVSALTTPEAAVEYFVTLVPRLGIDPERFAGEQRRRAFTLAESTNEALTARVREVISEGMRGNRAAADTTAAINRAFAESGVAPANPQYAEMVYRTNAMDSFQTGMWEEGRHPDVADLFPVWQYLGIDDERAGADHRPKFGKYYPARATFAEVRGDRPFNCRCSMRWVDSFEWSDLEAAGARTETSW